MNEGSRPCSETEEGLGWAQSGLLRLKTQTGHVRADPQGRRKAIAFRNKGVPKRLARGRGISPARVWAEQRPTGDKMSLD